MITPEQVVEASRKRIGIPFRHQGRTEYGLDCVGLIVKSAEEAGIDTSADVTNYSRLPHGVLLPILETAMVKLPDNAEWKPADVLVMKFINEPTHVALWTGDTVVHSYSVLGKVVEHRLDNKWKNRVVAVYRFKEFV